MNKLFSLFLIFSYFSSFFLIAQEPINVSVTGDCSDVSGVYTFNGVLNGKNNYVSTFEIDGETITIGVGFDGVKWVLYAEGDLADTGYQNIAVPNTMLPPFIGWTKTQCEEGTMIITQNLGISASLEFNTILYPNPSKDYFLLQNKTNADDNFQYQIIDLSGRITQEGKGSLNENIAITKLLSGNYFVRFTFDNNVIVTKKLIIS